MSVINQMLKDLDERKPVRDSGAALSGQIRVVVRRERVHSAWWAIVLLGLTMMIVGSLWFVQPQRGIRRLHPATVTVAVQAATSVVHDTPSAASAAAVPTLAVSTTLQNEAPAKLPDQLISFGLKTTNWLDLSHSESVAGNTAAATPATPATAASSAQSAHHSGQPAERLAPASSAARMAATASVAPGALPKAAALQPAPAVAPGTAATTPVVGVVGSAPLTPIKETTPRQRADSDYGRALTLMQEERTAEAGELLATVLQQDPANAAARQSQVSLLVGAKRYAEAERSLQDGLRIDRNQVAMAMILARLQVEQGDSAAGLKTLQQSLAAGTERAEYQGFLAALLQREGRHREAIEHYQQALRKVPQSGVWLTGMAISLQAENRQSEALDAFSRAQGSAGLSPELKAFVEQQLRQGGQR